MLMKRAFPALTSLTALAITLGACRGAEAPANEAANDMNAMVADPNNPFADAEMAMDQAINAAIGVNPGDSWVRKMIEHHRGAVEMSRIVLTLNPSPDVARMAQQTIDKQTKEIAALEKLASSSDPDGASAELYRPATVEMHQAMMAAKGADVSETYLRKMLAHHKGAVAMSDVALASGVTGAVRAQVEKTRADQLKEAEMVEAMLRGEPMPSAQAPESKPPAAAAAPARPAPAAKPAPAKPKPPAPAPPPAPDPHAGHDMNSM